MTTEQYIDTLLSCIKDIMGEPSTIEEDEVDFVWNNYHRTWCLARRMCDDDKHTIQKYTKKIDDFFVPYFARIQPIRKDDQNG